MSILMVCSCGQEMVTEDEHAGRKVRCPTCKSIVVVPGMRRGPVVARRDVGPREKDEDDPGPRPEGGLSTRDRLARARIGLGLHWGKTLAFLILCTGGLLSSLTMLIMAIAAASRSAVAGDTAVGVGLVTVLVMCLGSVVVFVMPVLSAIGSLMCFWLPRRSRGRVLSMVACGLDTAAFLFLMLVVVLFVGGSGLRRGPGTALDNALAVGGFIAVLYVFTVISMLTGWILHILVLKNLAEYTRYNRTARDVVRMMIIGLATLIAPPILIGMLLLLTARGGRVGMFIILFLLIAWTGGMVAVSFKMLNLTSTVRRLL